MIPMKYLVAVAAFTLSLATGHAQSDTPIAEVAQLRMCSSFLKEPASLSLRGRMGTPDLDPRHTTAGHAAAAGAVRIAHH
jgi:hypothetical protein